MLDSIAKPLKEGFQVLLKPLVAIRDGIANIGQGIENLVNFFTLENIGEMIKTLFVPDQEYFTTMFNKLHAQLNAKLDVSINSFESIKNIKSSSLTDIDGRYNGSSVTFVDFSAWNQYNVVFRKWISGFVSLLLSVYNCNQVYKLVRGTYWVGSIGSSNTNIYLTGGDK